MLCFMAVIIALVGILQKRGVLVQKVRERPLEGLRDRQIGRQQTDRQIDR